MSSAQSTTSGDSDVMQHCVPGDVLLHLRIEFKEGREVGSVLCESRGNARECVLLSHHQGSRPASGTGAAGNSSVARAPAMHVMAWVELISVHEDATADCRLFRHVCGQVKRKPQR